LRQTQNPLSQGKSVNNCKPVLSIPQAGPDFFRQGATVMTKQREHYLGAVFENSDNACALVEEMSKLGFPMDRVSILHKAGGQGDDILGIAYTSEIERFKVWGIEGALWGALGGLLAGAAGLFLLPGIGPVLIAGPLIQALAGAAVGAGAMTTGAAATHLTIALRRLGIPEDKLVILHQAIMDGKTVLLMHCGDDNPEVWRRRLAWNGADPIVAMP
jgi:hypothetical protein